MKPATTLTCLLAGLVSIAAAQDSAPSVAVDDETASSNEAISLFGDDATPVRIDGLPQDPVFDRYLPLHELALAWENADGQELARLAIQATDGERILFRSRPGLPASVVWQAAVGVAQAGGDRDALQDMARAAERLGKPELKEPLEATLALTGESRSSDPGISVNPMEVTAEDLAELQAHSRSIRHAALRGDTQYLSDVEHNVQWLYSDKPAVHDSLRQLLEQLREMSPEPVQPPVASEMEQLLLADSRIFGGGGIKISRPKFSAPKISVPKISTPKISMPKLPTPRIPKPRVPTMNDIRNLDIHDVHRAAKNAREDAQREGKNFRELIQREWVRGRKEVGKPWNRGIRDPWVRQLERWYNTGQAKLDEAQRKFDDGRSRFPMLLFGEDCSHRNVPGGRVDPQRFGMVLANAPQGGTIGYPVIHYYYYWGWNLRFAARFKVERGNARFIVKRSDGTVVAASDWKSAPFFGHETFDADLPSGSSGTSFKTEDGFGGKYLAAVQAAPNSLVDVWYVAYWRPDKSYYDPDKAVFSKLDGFLTGTWQTHGRTVTFNPDGTVLIQTPIGSQTFRFSYDPFTGRVVGTDDRGNQTVGKIRLLGSNSMEWSSPSGRRHYARARSY